MKNLLVRLLLYLVATDTTQKSYENFIIFQLLFAILMCIIAFVRCLTHKVLFLSNIFEIGILMDLQVLKSSESKNNIFSSWSVLGNAIASLRDRGPSGSRTYIRRTDHAGLVH